MARIPQEAMTTKYTMYGESFEIWRGLTYKRNYEKENRLKSITGAIGEYELHFENYGSIPDGPSKKPIQTNGTKIIKVERIDGFNLLDWSGIIENAKAIHAVSSSCIYLFEILNLVAKEIHLYSRKLGKRDFDYVTRLLTKNYIFHT